MDAECFKQRFLPFHAKLFHVARALVGNEADAEDLLQEAYYKLWKQRDELADIRNAEAFCVTLVKNLCLDFLRSPRANRHEEAIEEAFSLSTNDIPDNELERKERMKQVKRLIEHLPENQRQVLRLRSLDDCSMEEIEHITGLNVGNIRVLLSRARKTLREQLQNIERRFL